MVNTVFGAKILMNLCIDILQLKFEKNGVKAYIVELCVAPPGAPPEPWPG